jgi:Zn-dependent peptidase ImmA (M78 family)
MINRFIKERASKAISESGQNQSPVDLDKLCEHFGIHLDTADIGPAVSGLLVCKAKKIVIAVNSLVKDKFERRFIIAHCLGHFFLHRTKADLFIGKRQAVVMKNMAKDADTFYRQRREASQFAYSLLMPEDEVASQYKKTKFSLEELSDIFQVPSHFVCFRLSELGYEYGYFT